jgi:hypothetical protein
VRRLLREGSWNGVTVSTAAPTGLDEAVSVIAPSIGLSTVACGTGCRRGARRAL